MVEIFDRIAQDIKKKGLRGNLEADLGLQFLDL